MDRYTGRLLVRGFLSQVGVSNTAPDWGVRRNLLEAFGQPMFEFRSLPLWEDRTALS